ncbi:MAG: hypothetical protein ACI8Y3_000711 [Paraglaciecola sp.]|jgi:hypothetical protein
MSLIEAWGEPESHSTLHKLQLYVCEEYEDKLKIKRDSDPFSLSLETPKAEVKPKAEKKN